MQTALLVFLGGGFGSVLRWLTGLGAARVLGTGFPYGTLAVNLIGGLVMGVLAKVLITSETSARFLLMTGVLGGFTTFSAFSLDAANLYLKGEVSAAMVYVLLSVVGSLAAVMLGLALGTVMTR